MTHNIIKTVKREKRFPGLEDVRRAEMLLNVRTDGIIWDNRTLYGETMDGATIHSTTCGMALVVCFSGKHISAALCTPDFEWEADLADARNDHRAIARAAGLEGCHD